MKNKIAYLVFVFVFATLNVALSAQQQTDIFSIYVKANKPSRFYPAVEDDQILESVAKYKFGGGLAFNAIRLDYSQYLRGHRVGVNYDFFSRSIVSPYIGLTYIWGTDARITFTSGAKQKVDTYDVISGISIRLLQGMVVPYVDYAFILGGANIGLRLHFNIETKRAHYNN